MARIEEMRQKVFIVDVTKCTACFDCFIACKDEFAGQAWLPYSEAQPDLGHYWMLVGEIERGQFPKVKGCFLPQPCMLCQDPACATAVCQQACPAGIDVPRYIRAISEGKFSEAVAVIRQKVPFPAVLGYVCVQPCEAMCRRGKLEETIAIRELKRFAADRDDGLWKQNSKIAPPTGKKVAIVGSGPAGLTAGYYLAKLGHEVVVLEALPVAGGMMRVGIPSYRLPVEVLEKEIKEIENVGVKIRTNTRAESLDELFKQGYDAVFLATGADKAMRLGVPGEDGPGVTDCLSMLKKVTLGEKVQVGNNVLVVGGGNVAVEGARTALRLGAKKVCILCLECHGEMPAHDEQLTQAQEEGIEILPSQQCLRILREKEAVTGIECIDLKSMRFEKGQLVTSPIPASEHVVLADMVIVAVGQESNLNAISGIPRESILRGRAVADPNAAVVSKQGLYAGGDVVSGPSSVIEAIASGRRAAMSIDRYLGGEGNIDEALAPPEGEVAPINTEELEREKHRPQIRMLPRDERVKSFAHVVLGFEEVQAVEEAKRCLRCDLEDAVYKRDDGIVIIDPVKGNGKKSIVAACPYGRIYWNEELNIPQKCDFCAHFLDQGYKEPRCVEACPGQAIRFGEREEFAELIDEAEQLHPEYGTNPSLYYIGLPKTFVAGSVYCGESKDSIENGEVVLVGKVENRMLTTKTDNYGDFEFEGLEAGLTYNVRIEADGYYPITIDDIFLEKDVYLGNIPLQRRRW